MFAGSVVLLDRVSVSLAIVRHSAHIEPQMRTPHATRLVTIYEVRGHLCLIVFVPFGVELLRVTHLFEQFVELFDRIIIRDKISLYFIKGVYMIC